MNGSVSFGDNYSLKFTHFRLISEWAQKSFLPLEGSEITTGDL